jgi:hypothetical protein
MYKLASFKVEILNGNVAMHNHGCIHTIRMQRTMFKEGYVGTFTTLLNTEMPSFPRKNN